MGKAISTSFILLILGIVGGSQVAGAAEPKLEPATKWEYRVLSKDEMLELGKKDLVAGLNKLGDEGWELVTAEPTYIFKRPKQKLKAIEDVKRQLLFLQAEVEGWRDRVAWTERMVKKGYLTERHLKEETELLQAAEIALEKAQKEFKALPPEPNPEK
jgi:hypothetical protein